MRNAVQNYLKLNAGDRVIDGTLGLGGHAMDILKSIGKRGVLYAFDQDERNLREAKRRLALYEKQITYIHDNFRYLKSRVTGQVDAILFDLGLSSPHVDEAERGFSFNQDGPLDMRFDPRSKLTAEEVLETYPEEKLMEIFFKYGEERMSKKVAHKICEHRAEKPFKRTVEFKEFLEKILPVNRAKKAHPATKIFQALRMEVNDELTVIEEGLEGAMERLEIGGRIVVISYHSIEDRVVKQFFKELEQPPVKDQEAAIYRNFDDPIVEKLTRKPVVPTDEEIQTNPRSRSAKLRAYKKLR